MTVTYEWDVETVAAREHDDLAEGDIIEHHHCPDYREALRVVGLPCADGFQNRIVLVRDDDAGRSWAYVENHAFLGPFEDAAGNVVKIVPARFAVEIHKAAGGVACLFKNQPQQST